MYQMFLFIIPVGIVEHKKYFGSRSEIHVIQIDESHNKLVILAACRELVGL